MKLAKLWMVTLALFFYFLSMPLVLFGRCRIPRPRAAVVTLVLGMLAYAVLVSTKIGFSHVPSLRPMAILFRR